MSISNADKTRNMSDFFFSITNLNITWGNKTGILSTLTQKDLYLICNKNGLRQSWPMFYGRAINTYIGGSSKWYNGPGAPLCLNFGEDIPLLSEDYPGKSSYGSGICDAIKCAPLRQQCRNNQKIEAQILFTSKLDQNKKRIEALLNLIQSSRGNYQRLLELIDQVTIDYAIYLSPNG
jgi:hypothetical protein